GTDSAVWHASSSVGWLTITPETGTLAPGATATLSVLARPIDISPGNYSAQVKIETPNAVIRIPVSAAIAIGPKIDIHTTTLSFTTCGTSQSIKVNNKGDGPLTFTATPSDARSVKLDNSSGSVDPSGSLDIAVTMDCSAFFGDYTIGVL